MMLWNLALAVLWMLITNLFSFANLVVGMVIGFAVLAFLGAPLGGRVYARQVWGALGLLVFFLKELVVANIKMAGFTLGPLSRLRPGIVAVPLEVMSDDAVTVLANLITLTPGTLSVEVAPDRRTLYVHAMDVADPAGLVAEIKRGFERRVLEVIK
ncbi:MAG: Na+/H+ antiporter subunit E [Planctomycetaceae bacterium]|jgi:multicomponent Na+:H+ antiporter subunit E|nr:Na+/H+ antiporter subunit E [Phycisphaerales bacterium]MCE2654038.1 Na+/H+ antiporter subunit E [Planctomycetaceae bacterium]